MTREFNQVSSGDHPASYSQVRRGSLLGGLKLTSTIYCWR